MRELAILECGGLTPLFGLALRLRIANVKRRQAAALQMFGWDD
jgi:hypothetical protein